MEVKTQPLHFERLRFVVAAMLTAIVAGAPLGSDAQNEQSYHALSMPVVMTNSTNGALIGSFIGGLIGVLIGRRVFRDRYYERELAAENELRRRHRTDDDIGNLKRIATALEEYMVDNSGKFPKTLDELRLPYLNSAPYVPETDPPQEYTYDNPAINPKFGAWDLRDNGTFDPTQDNLRNFITNHLCTKDTCKYIIYAESGGIGGIL